MNNVTKMIPIVFSTAIRAVAYNEAHRALTIMFTSGGTYQFSGVNPRLAMGFTFAESPGTYYNEKIREQGFSSQKLVDNLFGDKQVGATVAARRPKLPNLVHASMAPSHSRVLERLFEQRRNDCWRNEAILW
jgi:hypothetical protein